MDNVEIKVVDRDQTRLLNIARAWDNSANAQGNQPKLRAVPAQNIQLGVRIDDTFYALPSLLFFANTRKRDGKQDPEYNVAGELPKDVANAFIAAEQRQRTQATGAPVAA